jgi:chromate transporter
VWHECAVATVEGSPALSFKEACRFWLKLGFISFGGPSGQIAIMHQELVERRRWVSEQQFLHALNYCMLLPGPEAQQLATYIGWLLHRTWGGIVAGTLFVLPSAVLLWVLSYVYVAHGDVQWVAAVFQGLKPAVLAIVGVAVIRIGRRALKNGVMWSLAGVAFVAIFFLKAPFPLIVFGAAMVGLVGGRFWREQFLVIGGHGEGGGTDAPAAPAHTRPSLARAVKVCLICLVLWWTPVLLAAAWLGWDHTLPREGVFFSKAAMVTFGGAYAVLPYVAQQAVEHYAWLQPGQMMDGLGLAETTPGPLVMVLQFVGFVGAWQQPGELPPLLAATLGAALTTWVTFIPCFLWIFLGAPHIEQLRGNERLTTALSAVTAAVVGVILNLAVWFGLHVLAPDQGGIDYFAVAVAAVSFLGMLRWKWEVIPVVIGAGLLGVARGFLL